MTTFAHLAPGSSEVLDPRAYASLEEYQASFGDVASRLWSEHTFTEVPDGTLHGATDNGDGTFTNPQSPLAEPKSWDAYDFKMRFTSEERKAIRTAAKVDADVEDFQDMLDTAAASGKRIVSDNLFLRAGLDLMEEAELIGAGRAAEILAD